MSDLVQRLRLAASDLTATMLDLRRIVVSPVLSAQQEATIRVLTDAAVEIERLWAEADEWAMRADGVVHNPHCTDDLPCLRCRAEQAERERDEAIALLQEVREWHRCPWKHGASVEVIDLQLHAAWIARLDAALGGRDE